MAAEQIPPVPEEEVREAVIPGAQVRDIYDTQRRRVQEYEVRPWDLFVRQKEASLRAQDGRTVTAEDEDSFDRSASYMDISHPIHFEE